MSHARTRSLSFATFASVALLALVSSLPAPAHASLATNILCFIDDTHTVASVFSISECADGDQAPTAYLTLVKDVVNTGGGTATTTDWTLAAAESGGAKDSISGVTGSASVTEAAVEPGAYALSERGGPSGYAAGSWSCTAGSVSGSSVTLTDGDDATCTITNTYEAPAPAPNPTLTITANATGGDGTFSFSISGTAATTSSVTTSGGTGTTGALSLSPGTYAVAATIPSGWSLTSASCTDGSSTASGSTVSAIALAAGANVACTFAAAAPASTTPSGGGGGSNTPVTTSTHSEGTGGGGPGCAKGFAWSPSAHACAPVGLVLGAATSTPAACGLSLTEHLRYGSAKNDPVQVTKLQQFLTAHGYGSFAVTGFFGPLTRAAVKSFQQDYASTVLGPWGIEQPTGLVYLTTIRQINLVACPALSLPMPVLVPWNENPGAQ